MQISKLRALKGKTYVPNSPKTIAKNKLIQIKRLQDQEDKIFQSDILDQEAEYQQLEQQNTKGLTKTSASITLNHYQSKISRQSSSVSKYMRSSKQAIKKQAISLINYTLFDTRVTSETPKITTYEVHKGLKLKLLPKRQKLLNLSRINISSFYQPNNSKRNKVKSLMGNTVCAIQMRNLSKMSKYPSLYYID